MKIDSLQAPKLYTKTKASNTREEKDDFSKLLSGAINKTKEISVKEGTKSDKTTDSSMEDIELDEETMESINTLLMFVNMPLFEESSVDIVELGGDQLVELSNESSIPLNLTEMDIVNIPMELKVPIASEGFVLQSLVGPEILVENKIQVNEETISFDDKKIPDGINVDKNIGNRFESIVKNESSNKNLTIDSEVTPVSEVKAVNLEEMVQSEEVDLTKLVEDEGLDIKKEEIPNDSKWLNHNVGMDKKVNVPNEIDQESKVISNENMQNINDHIIQLMDTTREGNTSVMKVQLYPEELGAVNITLEMENGKLIAKILVEDDYVRQLFSSKIEQLSNSLIKQNINIEEIFVELNSNSNPNSESGQNQSKFSNQNRGLKFTGETMEAMPSEQVDLNQGELSILA